MTGILFGKDSITGSNDPVAISSNNLHVAQYVWDINNLSWIKQTSSVDSGPSTNVNVTNASLASSQSGVWSVGRTWTLSNSTDSVAVTGTFWPTTQPVSGTITVSQLPAISGTVSISNFPVSQAVTGTFWQATQPVSIASVVPISDNGGSVTIDGSVSVSNFPVTQAVSGTVTANAGTGTFAVSGPLTDTQLRATAVPVSGSGVFTSSLGNTTGKTNVLRTGTLVTTAVTADQVILTYTVTSGKTFYIEYISANVRLTTFATTATNFGNFSLESPAATKLITNIAAGPGILNGPILLTFTEPIPITAGTVIRIVCTPSAVTSFTWVANFGGYEK